MPTLFDSLTLGELTLPNRVAMAALTRSRADAHGVPGELNATYYAQRAGMGLIITEGTNISPRSNAFERAPGLWTQDQVEGWRKVTDAVHQAGGRIFAQLWHSGRASAAGLLEGQPPLSPSGVNDDLSQLGVYGLLANGHYVPLLATPSKAMSLEEIRDTVAEYRTAAANARDAGFDGVEIHAANGYLPHQFLSPTTNQRTDAYGGSLDNRLRFLREVFEAIADELPPGRIGVRVSPYALYNNTRDPNPAETYAAVAAMLDSLQAAYLHFADMNGWFGAPDLDKILAVLRPNFGGVLIANGGIDSGQAAALVQRGDVQMVAFGRFAMANPDLVERLQRGVPLDAVRSTGWYHGGAVDYTDYACAT